jgi:hypothetical protein
MQSINIYWLYWQTFVATTAKSANYYITQEDKNNKRLAVMIKRDRYSLCLFSTDTSLLLTLWRSFISRTMKRMHHTLNNYKFLAEQNERSLQICFHDLKV